MPLIAIFRDILFDCSKSIFSSSIAHKLKEFDLLNLRRQLLEDLLINKGLESWVIFDIFIENEKHEPLPMPSEVTVIVPLFS